MPVDPNIVNPTLGPFRQMLAEVRGKGLSGPDVDAMAQVLGRMEALAQEMSDVTAYMGQLTQENSFQLFSDAYSRVLAGAARAAATSEACLLLPSPRPRSVPSMRAIALNTRSCGGPSGAFSGFTFRLTTPPVMPAARSSAIRPKPQPL